MGKRGELVSKFVVSFEVGKVGNQTSAIQIFDKITEKEFDTLDEAKQSMEDITQELLKFNVHTFLDFRMGVARECLVFRLLKRGKNDEELDYFLVELDERNDALHRKENKN